MLCSLSYVAWIGDFYVCGFALYDFDGGGGGVAHDYAAVVGGLEVGVLESEVEGVAECSLTEALGGLHVA